MMERRCSSAVSTFVFAKIQFSCFLMTRFLYCLEFYIGVMHKYTTCHTQDLSIQSQTGLLLDYHGMKRCY